MTRIQFLLPFIFATAASLNSTTAETNSPVRWTNSLGMIFVPVPETSVAFCIWETRLQDYALFVKEGHWGRLWPRKPQFQQETNHPVVNVSWDDAKAFCVWLTKREQDSGLLSSNQVYRLPTDREWSAAVGLPREDGRTPESRRNNVVGHFPWGVIKPKIEGKPGSVPFYAIPDKVANYVGATDGFKFTAPVGSFGANQLGIYDLGGNIWEWCIDFADDGRRNILRGGSWFGGARTSASRDFTLPDGEVGDFGFRCVRADAPVWLD